VAHLAAAHQTQMWGWELGNELNNDGPGTASGLQPSQQAAALARLAQMLAAAPPFAASRLVGPDTGYRDALTWLQGYLPSAAPLFTAVTHHVYNGVDRATFNSPSQLDAALPEIAWYTNVTRALSPGAQMWAGENGPTGGGDDGTCGSASVCGTYASTLWYADDMALRAKHGFVQHQRHDFFGGAYGLTNSVSGAMTLGPAEALVLRPDFWTAFLWKRTLGTAVLNATSSSANVRAYAFRGAPPSPWTAPRCAGGALQLLLLNLDNATALNVSLPVVPSGGGEAASRTAAWTLTALPGQPEGPFTRLSAINGAANDVLVDVAHVDPASFLTGIAQPPVLGTVAAGATLPPISTTFLCYY
jgi:hypothetical protein